MPPADVGGVLRVRVLAVVHEERGASSQVVGGERTGSGTRPRSERELLVGDEQTDLSPSAIR
jgi:hypothetical protein